MGKSIYMGSLRPKDPSLSARPTARAKPTKTTGNPFKSGNIQTGDLQAGHELARRLEVPKATQIDIERTLGTPRWRLFGLQFGPKNKITDIQLSTDTSGMAFGAFARINGRRVALDGALYARAAQRQIDLAAPVAPVPALKAALLERKIARRRTSVPKGQRMALAAAAPALEASLAPLVPMVSVSTLQTARSSGSSVSLTPSTPATSVYSEAAAPLSLADTARARWALYCDLAAEPRFFASDTEIAALALALGRDIRVLAKWPGALGSTFTVSDFSGAKPGHPAITPLTVVYHRMHYEPLTGDLAQAPLLSREHLQGALSPSDVQAIEAQLEANTRRVPSDGACFFHSIAALTGGQASDLRDQAVTFMRAHGETVKIASMSVEGFEQTLSDSYMPDPSSVAYKALMQRFPDPVALKK